MLESLFDEDNNNEAIFLLKLESLGLTLYNNLNSLEI